MKAPLYKDPKDLPEIAGLPELLRFADGRPVAAAKDWASRKKELLGLYSEYMYGYMPDPVGETLSWSLHEEKETGGALLHITVSAGQRRASFSVLAGLPVSIEARTPFPCFIEYRPWHVQGRATKEWKTGFSDQSRYAMERGYAAIQYDCFQVAQDNAAHTGAFYSLYPYLAEDPLSQRGVLLAWAWGVSKIIDALEAGAGKALGIDPGLSLAAGVSRFGKSAAVAGAYDERIRVVIPSCSGAGGTAVYRMHNHGKTYDLTALGGPAHWTNESINEPFANLQGGEGYWFCGSFAAFPSVQRLPVDQHMLCALSAGASRHMIMVTGITSEGWNNTEGQCLAYAASQPVWDLLGCGDQNNLIIHLDGHAVLRSDMAYILDYCDVRLRGVPPESVKSDLTQMKGNLFLEHNRKALDPLFDPYRRHDEF